MSFPSYFSIGVFVSCKIIQWLLALFFREVEPVGFEEYRKWLTDQGTDTDEYLSKTDRLLLSYTFEH